MSTKQCLPDTHKHTQGTNQTRPPDKKTILRMLSYGNKAGRFRWMSLDKPGVDGGDKEQTLVVVRNGVEMTPELQTTIEVWVYRVCVCVCGGCGVCDLWGAWGVGV